MAIGSTNSSMNTKMVEDITSLKNPEFTEADSRENIESKESYTSIFGKIKKYFTDLKTHAFNNPVNNLTTTNTGYALDAYQGKILDDKVSSIIKKGRVSDQTINIDISKYINTSSGDWVFLVFAHSRVAVPGAHTLSIISGVWSDYIFTTDIVKGSGTSPTISVSGTTLTITFYDSSGGTYGIIPVSEVF